MIIMIMSLSYHDKLFLFKCCTYRLGERHISNWQKKVRRKEEMALRSHWLARSRYANKR